MLSGGLAPLFVPQSIAVLGASSTPRKMGHRVMSQLMRAFDGPVYPVHPLEHEILGRRAYRELAALPAPVDLLVALVPAEPLLTALRDCASAPARILLAIPSGFAEASTQGRAAQTELVRLARAVNMRVVGPNTFGVLNGRCGLNASLAPLMPPGGAGLSCLTQSGGFGMAAIMYAYDNGLPVAKLCDLGNMADVEVAEVLDHYRLDPETRVAGLFLEATGAGASYTEALSALAGAKPTILVEAGRTADGARASHAHLGIAQPRSDPWHTHGPLIRAQTSQELLHIAKALAWQPVPRGRRVAILTGSGGVGAELVDLLVEHRLHVPLLSPALQAQLKALLPSYAAGGNPVDLTPIWMEYPRLYPPLIQALAASDEVDLIIATVIDVATGIDALIDALIALAGDASFRAAAKPLYIYWNSPAANVPNMTRLQGARIPCYQSPEHIARVAAALAHYGTAAGGAVQP